MRESHDRPEGKNECVFNSLPYAVPFHCGQRFTWIDVTNGGQAGTNSFPLVSPNRRPGAVHTHAERVALITNV
jgi:hypothetical protein